MILNILQLLKVSDFYGQSELIDIAKGRNELDYSISKTYKREKRKLLSKAYRNGN
jgi:hypothetical protein